MNESQFAQLSAWLKAWKHGPRSGPPASRGFMLTDGNDGHVYVDANSLVGTATKRFVDDTRINGRFDDFFARVKAGIGALP